MTKAAIFDIDNTILKGRSSERLFIKSLYRKDIVTTVDFLRFAFTFLTKLVSLNGIHIKDNKAYLKGKDVSILESEATRCFRDEIAPYISAKALKEIQEKKESGYIIVLLSGTLDVLIKQFKDYCNADVAIGTNLKRVDGHLTGELQSTHAYGLGKAKLLGDLALKMEIDLKSSYAYADHFSDIKFLSMVGNPVAVNAHPGLKLYAKMRGWPVVTF
ncbi:MAG: HAD-IB family hydrolase [Planctomycetes bacterium]|nr:HAD-IB family hydrolase [Planctomycetota bacterium]